MNNIYAILYKHTWIISGGSILKLYLYIWMIGCKSTYKHDTFAFLIVKNLWDVPNVLDVPNSFILFVGRSYKDNFCSDYCRCSISNKVQWGKRFFLGKRGAPQGLGGEGSSDGSLLFLLFICYSYLVAICYCYKQGSFPCLTILLVLLFLLLLIPSFGQDYIISTR